MEKVNVGYAYPTSPLAEKWGQAKGGFYCHCVIGTSETMQWFDSLDKLAERVKKDLLHAWEHGRMITISNYRIVEK